MRRILLILLAMTLLFLASCSSSEIEQQGTEPTTKKPEIVYIDPEQAYTVYVNDKKIAQATTCTNGYIDLPIIAVFRELGATVAWTSKRTVTILYNEQVFSINTADKMMYHGDQPLLDLCVGGGGPYERVFRVVGEEIFIDEPQLFNFFLGYTDIVVDFDHRKKEVYIKEESDL